MSKALSISKIDTIIASYRSGEKLAKIGADFGVSRQRIHQIIVKHGEPGRDKTDRDLDLIRSYEAGEAVAVIAARYGVSDARVRSIACALGVRRQNKS